MTATFSIIDGNSVINSTAIAIGSVIANTTALAVGNVIANTTILGVGANVQLSVSGTLVGNSTVNASSNATQTSVANSTTSVAVRPDSIFIGNSTVNVTINSTSLSTPNISQLNFGNSTANSYSNSTIFDIANSTSQTTITPVDIKVGANVAVNTSAIFVGNSTVNATFNGTALVVKSGLATGPVISLSSSIINLGNSSTNAFANSVAIQIANATTLLSLTSTGVAVGSGGPVQLLATGLTAGANVTVDTVKVFLGNATANHTSNSTIVLLANATATTNVTPSGLLVGNSTAVFVTVNTTVVAVGANVIANMTTFAVGTSVVNSTAIAATAIAVGANVAANTTTLKVGSTIVNSSAVAIGSGRALSTATPETVATGFKFTPYSIGNIGNITIDPANGNYQYGTNHSAATITAPASDCSVTILITNDGTAGTLSFSGFTVGSSTGDPLTTTNTQKFLVHIIRINGTSTYIIKALQ